MMKKDTSIVSYDRHTNGQNKSRGTYQIVAWFSIIDYCRVMSPRCLEIHENGHKKELSDMC